LISAYLQAVKKQLPELKICTEEPLRRHTSFRIGGPAPAMLFPASCEELSGCLALLNEAGLPFRILGAGTNVLAPDAGVDQVVICLKDRFTAVTLSGENRLEALAGASLAKTANTALRAGLTGLEFAHGIPGTVGGAVYMNAGAYGGEMKQVVTAVTVMDRTGVQRRLTVDDNTFAYRDSVFAHSGDVVVKAEFSLLPGEPEEIRGKMEELMERRRVSQPLELPSAGSTFKRPVGGYAGALIESAGLKGLRIGDAAVSEKHAGFVVNLGNATAGDVTALMAEIQKRVQAHSGIQLQPEVLIW